MCTIVSYLPPPPLLRVFCTPCVQGRIDTPAVALAVALLLVAHAAAGPREDAQQLYLQSLAEAEVEHERIVRSLHHENQDNSVRALPAAEVAALNELWTATRGPTHWRRKRDWGNPLVDPCTWYGLTVGGAGGGRGHMAWSTCVWKGGGDKPHAPGTTPFVAPSPPLQPARAACGLGFCTARYRRRGWLALRNLPPAPPAPHLPPAPCPPPAPSSCHAGRESVVLTTTPAPCDPTC